MSKFSPKIRRKRHFFGGGTKKRANDGIMEMISIGFIATALALGNE